MIECKRCRTNWWSLASPIGHKEPMVTLIDEELLQYAEIWAAAGHPHAVFPLTPQELIGMMSGQVMPII
ncbi:YbaK/EbsC family protein [Paenibacillus thiaminolyticus]|uniref:YbaK/EbsC family protein n=1 Tax=Paenibacillus thiaminolyticus TaxID=49283 RepID=UPI003D27C451